MDDVLDVAEVLVEEGAEGIVVWLLRIVGLVAVLAGLGLWLLTEMDLLRPPR